LIAFLPRGWCTIASPTMISSSTDSSSASWAQVVAGLVTRRPPTSRTESNSPASRCVRTPETRGPRRGRRTPTSIGRSPRVPVGLDRDSMRSTRNGSGRPQIAAAVTWQKNASSDITVPYACAVDTSRAVAIRAYAAVGESSWSCGTSSGARRRRTPLKGDSRSRARRRAPVTPASRAARTENVSPSGGGSGDGRRGIPSPFPWGGPVGASRTKRCRNRSGTGVGEEWPGVRWTPCAAHSRPKGRIRPPKPECGRSVDLICGP